MKVYQLTQLLEDLPRDAEVEIAADAEGGCVWAGGEVSEIMTDYDFRVRERKNRIRWLNDMDNQIREQKGEEPYVYTEAELEEEIAEEMEERYSAEDIERIKNRYLLIAYEGGEY